MKEEEKIEDALERFSKVFNGEKFSEKEIVSKVLRSLTPNWNAKVSAIQEGRNYDQLTFDQLRGNLLTYEMTILDTQGGENKKKSLALKASSQEEDSDENDEYDALLDEYTKLTQEYSLLKKKNADFQKQNEMLKNENISLGKNQCSSSNDSCKSCANHIKEIEKLKNSLAKFNESSKNLDKLLSDQKHANDKEGIGYNVNKSSKHEKKNKITKAPIRQPQAQ
ncbi:hypothetical protein PIB30_103304 [Stylosanthes scabra]|uniref:UBN2 domain-containing protein n=1 Tax=Stylosanthes scabra TaxID=79078 RepID=A0ABU6T0C1_9FABA|nr:hypothetical protein [Stylosanthes scabra]